MLTLDWAKSPTIDRRLGTIVADSKKFVGFELPNTVGSQIDEVMGEAHQTFYQHLIPVAEGNNVSESRRSGACHDVITGEQGRSHRLLLDFEPSQPLPHHCGQV